jgi:formylglycine-generating enzyme required for sulfatase activity
MRYYLALLCLGFSLFAWDLSAAEPKKVALLVGVNKYQRRGFPDLNYAERDVEELASELKKLGFQTSLLKGSSEGNAKASRANIEAALQELVADTGKEDIVLVSLSGHGATFDVKQLDGTSEEDAFFCPVDATLGDLKTLLSLSYLIDDVLATKGGRNLLLVDACRDKPQDEPTKGVLKRGIQGKRVELPENTAVLFACSAGQESVESPRFGGGHGAFTYCLLEALRNKADTGVEVTWAGIVEGVETLMASEPKVRKVLDKASPQYPIHAGHVRRTVLGKVTIPPPASLIPSKHPESPSIETYINSIGMKLVSIPAGEFEMGSPSDDQDASDNEKPQHRVRISKPFYLGMHEVTVVDFLRFYHAAKYKIQTEKDGHGLGYTGKGKDPSEFRPEFVPWHTGFDQGHDHPVVMVSWNDAQAFCQWLSKKEGQTYRLPTEAEWEYACRAGTNTRYAFGNESTQLAAAGNVADASLKRTNSWFSFAAAYDDQFRFTAPVGSFRPNAFGLYDMHGNASEWCQDWYEDKYYGKLAGLTVDPKGATNDHRSHVYRGGSWSESGKKTRSAARYRTSSETCTYGIGFRVALERTRY